MYKIFTFLSKAWMASMLCLTINSQVQAQSCTSFLTQVSAKDMVLDGKYLWIATQGGLVKMDTATMEKTYLTKDNAGLPVNALTKLKKTASGDLWMITQNGMLVKYASGTFNAVNLKSELSLSSAPILTHIEAVKDTLYVAGKDVLYKYTPVGWTQIPLNYAGIRFYNNIEHITASTNKLVISVMNSGNGNNYIHFVEVAGTKQSLIKEFQMTMVQGGFVFGDKNIWSDFALDNSGNIWTRIYEGGIAKLDINTKDTISYMVPSHIRNCPNIYFSFLRVIGNKLYCGGTGKNGLVIFNLAQKTWATINESNSDMSMSDIISQAYINDDTYFLGNEQNVIKTKIKTKECVNIELASSKFQTTFAANANMVEDKLYVTGSRYFGDEDSLMIYDFVTKTWSKHPSFGGWAYQPGDIVQDEEGTSWIPTRQGLFSKAKNSSLISQYVQGEVGQIDEIGDLAIDGQGNKWLNADLGIYKVDPQGATTRVITRQYRTGTRNVLSGNYLYGNRTKTYTGLLRINIASLAVDSITTDNYGSIDGVLSLASKGDTLYYSSVSSFGRVVNGQAKRLFTYGENIVKLPADVSAPFIDRIYSLDVDQKGIVWLVAGYSLYSFDPRTNVFTNYDYASSCLSLASKVKVDAKGRKLIGSPEGLYIYDDVTVVSLDKDSHSQETYSYVYKDESTQTTYLKLVNSTDVAQVSIIGTSGKELLSTQEIAPVLALKNLQPGVYVAVVNHKDGQREVIKFLY